ncbi:hypothetical protein niasHT_029913 [Heterodera trifolii]|uniref:Uncharacterized protein n=1 Tax=Heterodera trifolii TaxID=157864 RepID=A0ABD2KBG0_9BILA
MDVVDDPSFNILYGSHDLLRLKHIIDYESEVLRLGGGRTTSFMTKQEYINETGYESPLGAVGPIHQFLASLNEIVPEDPELIDDNEEGESSVISWAVETSGVGVLKIGCLMSQNNYLYETLDELKNSFDTMERDPSVHGIVIMSTNPKCFMVGAHIATLLRCETAEEAERISNSAKALFNRMESSKKPVRAMCSLGNRIPLMN